MNSSAELFKCKLAILLASEGLDKDGLAKRSGVNVSLLNKYLRGETTPSLENLDKIASAFKGWSGARLIDPGPMPIPALSPARRRLISAVDGLEDDEIDEILPTVDTFAKALRKKPARAKKGGEKSG